MPNHPRQHERVRGKRDYTVPEKVIRTKGYVTMVHQHHSEQLERLAKKGLVIARSSFPMDSFHVEIRFRDDEIKDLLAGHTVEKSFTCPHCKGTDEYKFTMRPTGEEPEWTVRTGKAPPGSTIRGDVRVERNN